MQVESYQPLRSDPQHLPACSSWFVFVVVSDCCFYTEKKVFFKKKAHENITTLADIAVFSHKALSVLFQANLKHKLTTCNKLSFV